MFLRSLFERLIAHWKIEHPLVHRFNVIVPLSYGTLPCTLAVGSSFTTTRAAQLHYQYPDALIVFAPAANCFRGSGAVEADFRRELFASYRLTPQQYFFTAPIFNSIQEAAIIRHFLREQGVDLGRSHIVVIGGESHSRRAYAIWQYIFPEAQVTITTIPYRAECQPDHPLPTMRSPWRFLLLNVVHWLVLHLPYGLGFCLSRRLVHRQAPPTST